jgi:hypothetical protein
VIIKCAKGYFKFLDKRPGVQGKLKEKPRGTESKMGAFFLEPA